MAEYAFYSFVDETMLAWGTETLPVPVRREVEEEVFGGEEVRADLLLEELELFLDEFPELGDLYAGTMETLAWLAGTRESMEGDAEAAARYLEMGLGTVPDSLLLRSNYALALQLQGRGEDALEQYEVVLADPDGGKNPMVRLLAARLYAEQGEYAQAYRLLDAMACDLPADDAFWDFLAEMRELAGAEDEEEMPGVGAGAGEGVGVVKAALSSCPACGQVLRTGERFCSSCGREITGEAPLHLVCPACGKELPGDVSFCNACGTPVHREEPRFLFCSGCGNQLREDAGFCRKCGKPVET